MSEGVQFKPASKKQEQFINSDSFVTVYGGAAGSGKVSWVSCASYCTLMTQTFSDMSFA